MKTELFKKSNLKLAGLAVLSALLLLVLALAFIDIPVTQDAIEITLDNEKILNRS